MAEKTPRCNNNKGRGIQRHFVKDAAFLHRINLVLRYERRGAFGFLWSKRRHGAIEDTEKTLEHKDMFLKVNNKIGPGKSYNNESI